MNVSRRNFVHTIGSSVAALGALSVSSGTVEAQLIDKHTDWKFSEFEALVKSSARAKQVFDVKPIGEGMFLSAVKNSLNGLHFGYNIPTDQIKIVVAMHGPANMLNFNDSMWEKYRIGEWLHVTDPATSKPAVRNIYYTKKTGLSTDPEQEGSAFQDAGMAALQDRGVKFLSCHTATEAQARVLVEKYSLKVTAEEIVQDLQAHTVPGVLIVPSMVATISLLQSEGHYSYISA